MNRLLTFLLFFAFACSTSSFQGNRKTATETTEHPAFMVTASCSMSCGQGARRIKQSAKRLFDPKDTPYTFANNNLVPILTLRLSNLADNLCLETAIRSCGDAKQVSYVQTQAISSGQWSTRFPLECSSGHCAVSPYEDISKLEIGFSLDAVPAFSAKAASAKPNHCTKNMTFNSCFGDCTSDICTKNGAFMQTLTTPEPGGTSTAQVCMDDLEAMFKKEKTPIGLQPILCRLYARNSVLDQKLNQKLSELTCSAFRIDTSPCDQYR